MIRIALINEGKIPADNRVALTPAQCKWVHKNFSVQIIVESSSTRCFSDREFLMAGVEVKENVSDCAIFLGIKEFPVENLIPEKTFGRCWCCAKLLCRATPTTNNAKGLNLSPGGV